MSQSYQPEKKNWISHLAPIEGLERIEAFFLGNAYGRHRHDTFSVGITLQGLQTFNYRNCLKCSVPGDVMVLHPDEPHDGQAGTSEGFGYRMAYICPALLQQALGGQPLPFIDGGISNYAPLRMAAQVLLQNEEMAANSLASNDALIDLATALISASGKPISRWHGDFQAAQIAREYIHESVVSGLSLEELEAVCGRDRWSLSRDFKAFFGTSPYRYLTMRRIDLAKRLMLQRQSLADVSLMSGFSDQSHMTRQFAQTFGISPAKWLLMVNAGKNSN
jgi:AraC-like DNA-binding protein